LIEGAIDLTADIVNRFINEMTTKTYNGATIASIKSEQDSLRELIGNTTTKTKKITNKYMYSCSLPDCKTIPYRRCPRQIHEGCEIRPTGQSFSPR
jgi:hypothetical protein